MVRIFLQYELKNQKRKTTTKKVQMENKKKMILIEDSIADATLVRLAVEESEVPLDIVHYSDGEQVKYAFEGNKPDKTLFILLDLNIPKANGADILRMKQHASSWTNIPVIVYSSSNRPEDIRLCMDLGASAYICKPVDFSDFSRAIGSLAIFWGDLNLSQKLPESMQ